MSDENNTPIELSDKEQVVVKGIEQLTVIEANNVAKYFEETYGISAAPAVAVAAASAGAGAEEVVEEKSSFDVVLKDCGSKKIAVIKIIRELTGLALGDAKKLAEDGGEIKKGVPKDEAKELETKFKDAGATVELA